MPAAPVAPDPAELSADSALTALRAGTLTSAAYVETLLERSDRWRELNAFTQLDAAAARDCARRRDAERARGGRLGPLHGLPLIVKDNIDVAGWATTAGTRALASHRPSRSAPIVGRLLAAGAFVLGKNTLHELAHGITCENPTHGPVRNPYDPARIPGGSSGGTAAAVAARLAPAGLGTDTGGSVRIPAALCGVAGFRPSTGRYPRAGLVPISHTRDTAGLIAREVRDLALLDAVATGAAHSLEVPPLAGLRLGVPRALYYTDLDPEIEALTRDALARLAAAGVVLVEADVPGLERLSGPVAGVISDFEFPRDLAAYLAAAGIALESVIAGLASPDLIATFANEVQGPNAPSEASYREALEVGRPAIQAAFRAHFAAHALDALVFPTTPLPARPIGAGPELVLGARRLRVFETYLRNARPATTAGLPALSLPLALTRERIPIGIELDGAAGSDRRLLAVGAAIEALLGPLPAPVAR